MRKHNEDAGEILIIDTLEQKGKNKTKITFKNGKKAILSDEAYLSAFLYPGKKVTKEEWSKILLTNNESKLKEYLESLLSRRMYSPKELLDKLMTVKHLTYGDSLKIVDKLKAKHLIDEEKYASELAEELHLKGFAKEGIRRELKAKQIEEKTILKVLENTESDENPTFSLIENVIRKNKQDSYLLLEIKIKKALALKGYSLDQAEEYIEQAKMRYPELTSKDREYDALLKEAKRIYDRLLTVKSNPSLKRMKFKKMLLSKGFLSSDIEDIIRKEGYYFD